MKTTLRPDVVGALANRIAAAQDGARAIAKLTDEHPGMSVMDGYAVQLELRRLRLSGGHRQTGWKAGLTSRAKMDQMGVGVPSIGFLLESMYYPEGSPIQMANLLHPRVECEIAFVTKARLAGSSCTCDDVLAATDFVVPALEIIDSRFAGFKFDLPSVVADNCSAARYVTGGRAWRPEALDLSTLGVVLEKNGEAAAIGASAAVMGHPADAVALLVRVLDELGLDLPEGSFVMSGAITEAIAVQVGDHVTARFQELGSVGVRFV